MDETAKHYAAGTVAEYPEITEEWRQLRLRAQLEQAWQFGAAEAVSNLAKSYPAESRRFQPQDGK